MAKAEKKLEAKPEAKAEEPEALREGGALPPGREGPPYGVNPNPLEGVLTLKDLVAAVLEAFGDEGLAVLNSAALKVKSDAKAAKQHEEDFAARQSNRG